MKASGKHDFDKYAHSIYADTFCQNNSLFY